MYRVRPFQIGEVGIPPLPGFRLAAAAACWRFRLGHPSPGPRPRPAGLSHWTTPRPAAKIRQPRGPEDRGATLGGEAEIRIGWVIGLSTVKHGMGAIIIGHPAVTYLA